MHDLYSNHKKFHVALDCIIFGFDENELKLLLIKRGFEPEIGKWSLMGGFLKEKESLKQAAARVLENLTGLTHVYMEQTHTYGAPDRDPVSRTLSVAYYALIRSDLYNQQLAANYGAEWFSIANTPALIFDHNQMVKDALEILKIKSKTFPIGLELLPERFSIPQIRKLYEAINQQSLDHRNFSKKIKAMPWLKKLPLKDKSGSKKGAYLYEFDPVIYRRLQANGHTFSI
ncbi:MAG: NUDIX hydrolase [Cyclobacteriaceae bacterium]